MAARSSWAALVALLFALWCARPARAANTWWKPNANGSEGWQYQLGGNLAFTMPTDRITGVNIYVVDHESTPATTVSKMLNAGLKPVCYFSAGSIENYRSDYQAFVTLNANRRIFGNVLDGWPDEMWLNTADSGVRALMLQRIKACKNKGFIAIDPDNVDGWTNDNGLGLTKAGAINYLRWLATQAHALNMSCGVKNALDILPDVVGQVDFAINEQCFIYDECGMYAPLKAAGKPVVQIEYYGEVGLSAFQGAAICGKAAQFGTTPIYKKYSLNKWRYACPGKP